MIHRELWPALICLATLSAPVVADDVPKPDGMKLIYQHDFEDSRMDRYQIFIVNEKPRTKISTKTTKGTPWTDEWHDVRISRNIECGEVQVYFDDMQTPAMTATDKTFGEGRVGFGSFDDIGNFDDVRIYIPE